MRGMIDRIKNYIYFTSVSNPDKWRSKQLSLNNEYDIPESVGTLKVNQLFPNIMTSFTTFKLQKNNFHKSGKRPHDIEKL